MSRSITILILTALVTAACGESGTMSPVAPSSATTPVSGPSAGALIVGNVTLGAAPGAASMASTQAAVPLTAIVVGTSISSPVGARGEFSLADVPEGAVQLRFVGSGVDATAGLDPVRRGDSVSVLVTVSGTSAVVESQSRNSGGQVEFEGRIESLPPTQPANTLVVAGRTITVDAQTGIRDGSGPRTFAALAIGQRVHVKGRLDAGVIIANSITIQNTDVTIPVNVNGTIERLTGTAAAFAFVIGSREIRGDATTAFFGEGSNPAGFASLKNGVRVEVKGLQRDAFVFAARIHVSDDDDDDDDDMPPPETSASVEGRLKTLTGTPPALTLTIGTTRVVTTAATVVRRRGDTQTLAALAIGQEIHAVGARQGDGSILARLLQIKDDESDGEFEIEGSIGGLTGTCPSLRFGVNGYTIVTTADTEFEPGPNACAQLKNGAKVEVEGRRQADGTVKAEEVTRK